VWFLAADGKVYGRSYGSDTKEQREIMAGYVPAPLTKNTLQPRWMSLAYGYCNGREQLWQMSRKFGTMQERMQRV